MELEALKHSLASLNINPAEIKDRKKESFHKIKSLPKSKLELIPKPILPSN